MAAKPNSQERMLSSSIKLTRAIIGKGKFGQVFKGENIITGTPLAIKVTKRDNAKNLAEVKELKKLRNSTNHIVQHIEEFQNDKHLLLVMEFCNGGDFSRTETIEKLTKSETLCRKYFAHFLAGLKVLDDRGMMHRDLKPANLLLHGDLEKDGVLKITDLGFAKEANDRGLYETQLGTPMYEAPERLQGKTYAFPAEMWAAGCILYEWLEGGALFKAAKTESALVDMAKDMDKHLKFKNPNLTAEVKNLIRNLVVFDPEKRLTVDEAREHPWFKLASLTPQPAIPQVGSQQQVNTVEVSPATPGGDQKFPAVDHGDKSINDGEQRTTTPATTKASVGTSPEKGSTSLHQSPLGPTGATPPTANTIPKRKYVDPMKGGTTGSVSTPGSEVVVRTGGTFPADPPAATVERNSSFGSQNNVRSPPLGPSDPSGSVARHPPSSQQRVPSAPPENLSLTSFNNTSLSGPPAGLSSQLPTYLQALEHAKVIVMVAEQTSDAPRRVVLYGYASFVLHRFIDMCESVKQLHATAMERAEHALEDPIVENWSSPTPSSLLVSHAIRISQEAAMEEGFKNRYVGPKSEPIHDVYKRSRAVLDAAALSPDLSNTDYERISFLAAKIDVRIRATI